MNYLASYCTDTTDGTLDYRHQQDNIVAQTKHYIRLMNTERFRWNLKQLKETNFWLAYKYLLTNPIGVGYWLWKPYIILDALHNIDDGEIILWLDVDLSVRQSPQWLIDQADEHGIAVQDSRFNNCDWTRRDCFVLMDCDEEKYWKVKQIWGAMLAFKKLPWVQMFVTDWLMWSLQEDVMLGNENKYGKPDFADGVNHRWLQSILTNLIVKNNIYIEPERGEKFFGHPPKK